MILGRGNLVMSGLQIPAQVAMMQQQQAALLKLRIDIAVGIHRDLVARSVNLDSESWRGYTADWRARIAEEAVANADALLAAVGIMVKVNGKDAGNEGS
jgi:hypothetical protein